MGDYLKDFEKHSEYETYSRGDMLKPNVSCCEDNNEVHYNPWVDSKLVCKYNVTSISSPTQLRTNYESNVFKSMEIDGVQLDNLATEYTFDSTGVHTVKYELYDETKLSNNAPAFYGITSLISVSIPDSVTSIGQYTFAACTSLTRVTIPSSVTSIGSNAFSGCTSLTRVTIPSSVTNIGGSAFAACASLTRVTIGTGVTSIGSGAFAACTSLTRVTIGTGVTSIGDSAFAQCDSLVSITVDSNNSTYDSRNNCNAIIETATNTLIAGCKNTVIPNSVTSIGSGAFYNCNSLTRVTIPSSVTNIGSSAFSGCTSLTSVTIPNSATSIGSGAFSGCTSLTSVTIPNSVTSIGSDAFHNCTSLTSVTVEATTAPTIQNNTFSNIKTNGTLIVPSGSSGYDVWMGTGNYYLGKYNWTKVEQ